MNFNKKWLYVVVLSAILVPLIIIFVLSVTDPTKKKEEVKINDASYTTADGKQHVYSVEPFSVIKKEGDLYTFQVKHSLSNAGSFKVSYRMFPKNPELPHRQDFCYVRWFI